MNLCRRVIQLHEDGRFEKDPLSYTSEEAHLEEMAILIETEAMTLVPDNSDGSDDDDTDDDRETDDDE